MATGGMKNVVLTLSQLIFEIECFSLPLILSLYINRACLINERGAVYFKTITHSRGQRNASLILGICCCFFFPPFVLNLINRTL